MTCDVDDDQLIMFRYDYNDIIIMIIMMIMVIKYVDSLEAMTG